MAKKRIVVTGLGVVSSIGTGKDIFWGNLIEGKSGISEVSAFDTSAHATHIGGEVKDFHLQPVEAKGWFKFLGRASQMAVKASELAISDAALTKNDLSARTVSVCMGTTMGEIPSMEKINYKWIKTGNNEIGGFPILQSLPYNISTAVALTFNCKGKSVIFTTACASGNYAISYGYDILQAGDADIIIAGGSDAMSWISFTGFNKVGATAPEKCQPFDKNRKGMIPAEGAGVLILETLDHAKSRNAPIYAEILGCGFSCDAHHMTQPKSEGIAECISDALKRSYIQASQVDYICAHGTGSIHNDKAESSAIGKIFGKTTAVSSIKSMLGHTMGAASAIEAIACCLSVKHNVIPPTINHETPDPDCDIDCVPNKSRKKEVNIALNNAFAFGGNNSCLAIGKYA